MCSKFIKDFDGSEYIVAPSASCTGFVRNYYSKLFDNSSEHNKVKRLSERLFEFSEFMIKVLKVDDVGATLEGRATYHDSCAGLREWAMSCLLNIYAPLVPAETALALGSFLVGKVLEPFPM